MPRTICTGVMMKPQGRPHQPSTAEQTIPRSCLGRAHERQEILGRLDHDVTTKADQTQ